MALAFVVGFLLGGSGGSRDRHDVVDSFGAIRDSEEVGAFVLVARSQVGRTLREVADMVDGHGREVAGTPDLVDRVRQTRRALARPGGALPPVGWWVPVPTREGGRVWRVWGCALGVMRLSTQAPCGHPGAAWGARRGGYGVGR